MHHDPEWFAPCHLYSDAAVNTISAIYTALTLPAYYTRTASATMAGKRPTLIAADQMAKLDPDVLDAYHEKLCADNKDKVLSEILKTRYSCACFVPHFLW
jgi:hypothetical protein